MPLFSMALKHLLAVCVGNVESQLFFSKKVLKGILTQITMDIFILTDIKKEMPIQFMRHVLFLREADGLFYDCMFWMDGDGKRHHITPNLYDYKHLEDDSGFTHWLKPIPFKSVIKDAYNRGYADRDCDIGHGNNLVPLLESFE